MAKSKSSRPAGEVGSAANQANQSNRKARASITVFDQPSSLNSRIKQLETDVLRLEEDRTKLADDIHSQLAQCELKLTELYAILKSRQDNVERYADDIKSLLISKNNLDKRAAQLSEQYDRLHEKFVQRETNVSRDIRTFKAKFTALEKNKQIGSILQKCEGGNKLSNASKGEQPTSREDEDCFEMLENEPASKSLRTDEGEGESKKFLKTGKEVKSRLAKLSGFSRVMKPHTSDLNKQQFSLKQARISALVRLRSQKPHSKLVSKSKPEPSPETSAKSIGMKQNLARSLVQRFYSLLHFRFGAKRVVPKSKTTLKI